MTCSICGYTTYKEVSKVTAAQLEIYEENGRKYVDFGSYPQTHVANQDLINELNKLNETNERGYYEYNKNEYAKVKADPYSTNYTDQYGQTHNFKYSSGADIKNNTYEWFKVEPIKWRILSNNSDTYYVLSEYILTTQLYHKDAYYRLIDGVDVPANDYKYSDIREFLTNTFLNSAFTLKQQDSLVITGLDNSAIPTASSSNTYVWENTFDKIYLLSFQDMYNINYGFHSNAGEYDEARKAALTDYAKATGCWRLIDNDNLDMGFWWLRSPDSVDPRFAGSVNYNGVVSMHTIFVSYVGVRPATAIAIQ